MNLPAYSCKQVALAAANPFLKASTGAVPLTNSEKKTAATVSPAPRGLTTA